VQCKLYQHSVGHPWVFVVIMDSSSRQRDKQGLAMAMKSSFKHSCSSKRDEQGLAMVMRSSFKGSYLSKYSVRRLWEES